MPTPILIDTDMALDDWMAILYLLRNQQADVKAITIAATGEAHAGPGACNALRLLELVGHAPIPVAAGSETPLRGEHAFPTLIRFVMDRLFFLKAPLPAAKVSGQDALSLITQTLEANPDPVTILALGPLTNLAQVFLTRPELAAKVAAIIIMGGALDVPGNIQSINPHISNKHAEWNIFIDPYAANVVFSSGVPVTLVPLDATNQVPLSREYLAEMQAVKGSPALDFVRSGLKRITRLSRGQRIFYFWDPLAAILTLHPEIASFENRALRVLEEEGPLCGRVIAVMDSPIIRICTQVDRAAFERLYLQGMA